MADEPHDLTAAYALDALDDAEVEAFESHLRTCERCRDEVASLRGAAAAIAHTAPPAEAPAELRERILGEARRERPNVVPLHRRRRVLAPIAAAAAVAACTIAGLAVWTASLHNDLGRRDRLLAVLADPGARHVALQGVRGTLVVAPDGRAALVASLAHAPSGKTYELWVIRGSAAPEPAGLYGGGGSVLVGRRVEPGTTVAVTLERAGGVGAPTTKPLLTASA
ncbi:MAG TPA: anti-sigma factor [Gaiellaceae bacterium]|nr:anti-sigma factor [Gaiellaceae bacterium]